MEFELSPLMSEIAIALVAIALYAFAWFISIGQRLSVRVATRLGLALLLLAPVLVGTYIHYTRGAGPRTASAPATSRPSGGRSGELTQEERAVLGRPAAQQQSPQASPAPSAAPPPVAQPSAAAPPPAPRQSTEQTGAPAPAPARKQAVEQAPTGASPPPPPQVAIAPPPPPPPPAPQDAARPAPQPEPKATATAQPWDVVPVYYGTDRALNAESERVNYTSERGRRLDLGRALVTVPRSHEVPNVERPWVYRLPFTQIVLYREREDASRHFTLKELRRLSTAELAALVQERLAASRAYKDHAIVFVHGFNTTFDAAVFRTAQISYDLQFDGAAFLYSWPSKGQLGLQDYSYDRESTGQAEPYLRQFLEFVAKQTGARSISVIAHSMGNQVLLPVLRDLKRSAPETVSISQIILAAPDVDRDGFEFVAREIVGVSRGITLFASANDLALNASRRFWGGIPRAGDVFAGKPLVVAGIDTIDVTAVSTDLFSLNHNGYAEKAALLGDIRLLIQTGERPPEKRVPTLLRVPTDKGDFWRYPPAN